MRSDKERPDGRRQVRRVFSVLRDYQFIQRTVGVKM